MAEKQSKLSTGKGGKRAGAGRPKGSLDKGNALIRDMLAQALDELGGVQYLVECGRDSRTKAAFLGLIGKMLPMQVTGEGGGPVQTVARIELVALGNSTDSASS